MRKDYSRGTFIYSPSDLITYANESAFASFMERAKLEDPDKFKPLMDAADVMQSTLQEKGYDHGEHHHDL